MALRQAGTLYYLLTDHLGSTALTVDSSGVKVGELRYRAYGETRYTSGTTPTSRRFTGQLEEGTIGLYDYGARFYDPLLGRFLSADTVVPEPGNPQALNRYAYVLNNPLKYIDPTGHRVLLEDAFVTPSGVYVSEFSVHVLSNGTIRIVGGGQYFPTDAHRVAANYAPAGIVPEHFRNSAFAKGFIESAVQLGYANRSVLSDPMLSMLALGAAAAAMESYDEGMGGGASVPAGERLWNTETWWDTAARKAAGRQLYRGLPSDHPQLEIYKRTGIVQPWGGDATLEKHVNWNETRSNYTSWTTDPVVARRFAGPGGTVLTVNEADIPNRTYNSYLWSRFPGEREVTIEGPVHGAQVVP